jgi:hypothetical protein
MDGGGIKPNVLAYVGWVLVKFEPSRAREQAVTPHGRAGKARSLTVAARKKTNLTSTVGWRVVAPKGRRTVATGGAQRNPWTIGENETSAPKGRRRPATSQPSVLPKQRASSLSFFHRAPRALLVYMERSRPCRAPSFVASWLRGSVAGSAWVPPNAKRSRLKTM